MVSHSLITPAPPGAVGAPTYGELLALARDRAHAAATDGTGPFRDAAHAAAELMGYERFLAVVGRHLRLIRTPAPHGIDGHRDSVRPLPELVQRLAELNLTPPSDGRWGRTADALATAHDLLATHLGPYGEGLSPDAPLLDEPGIRSAAVDRVLALVDEPLRIRRGLLVAASAAQRGAAPVMATRSVTAHLRQATDAIADLLDRYRATSGAGQHHAVLDKLDSLPPALPSARNAEPTRTDPLDALRTLRLLSFRQARGSIPASPVCLHDLARLASAVTNHGEAWLPPPKTPLDRVRRATALDQLVNARDAWESAATSLRRHTQGLTKAPRAFADALDVLGAGHTDDAIRRAVLAALPRLGCDVAETTERLSRTGCLVTPVRQPGRAQPSWRLLPPDETDALAAQFARAGRASKTAWNSVASLEVDHLAPTERIDEPARQRRADLSLTVPGRAS